MTDTTDKIIIQSETQGVSQATNEVQGLSKAMDGVTVASQNVEKSTTSVEGKFAALERRFGSAAGQAGQFEKIQQTVNQAVAQNPALQSRANEVLAIAERRYGGVSQALEKQRSELDRLANVQKTVNQSTGVTGLSDGASRSSDIANYGRQLDDLRAKYSPLYAAQRQYTATLIDINQAAKVGAISEKERAEAITNTKVAFVQQVNALRGAAEQQEFFARGATRASTATEKVAQGSGLARHELINLSRQAQDVAVSLASGQSPFTVLMQQGTQIADVFATSNGTVRGFFGQIASGAATLLTPMRLLIGGAVGAGAAAVLLGNNWHETSLEIERSLIGIGKRTGETVQSVSKFANDNASLAGLSVSQAREAALELTKTGDVAVSSLTGLGDAIHGYAVLTGTDATDATKTLAKAFSGDLVKGAEQLNQTYGTMNSTTMEHIRVLQQAGDRTAAIQVIIDANREANLKAANSVSFLTQAYTGLKNVLSNIYNGGPTSSSPQEMLANLQKQRDAAANSSSLVGSNKGGYGLLNTGALYGGKSQELADLDRQIDDLQKKINAFDASRVQSQLNGLSTAGDRAVKSIIPQIEQLDALEQKIKAIRDAQNTPGVERGMGGGYDEAALRAAENQANALRDAIAESARYNQNIAQLQQSWGGVSQSTALALQQLQNQLPVAQAVTGAAQMRAQAEATYNNLLLQGKTAFEASLVASKQLELSQAAATSSVERQVDAIKDSTKMLLAQQNGTEAQTAAAIAYKNAIKSGADETSAAALASATLQNNLIRAQMAAGTLGETFAQAAAAISAAADALDSANESAFRSQERAYEQAYEARGTFDPVTMPKSGGSISGDPNNPLVAQGGIFYKGGGGGLRLDTGTGPAAFYSNSTSSPDSPDAILGRVAKDAYTSGGIDASIRAVMGQAGKFSSGSGADTLMSQVGSLFDFKNSLTNDKAAQLSNLATEMAWLNTLPDTLARDQKISDLQKSIDQLRDSTDGLNRTNQDLLSPYYSQDPRTSHIGFRSQGMASGGYVDVPGVPSANDNMTAIIPVASGERIYVDPMPSKRGGIGGSTQTIVINMGGITVGAGAQRDQVGRTVYQATQRALKQFQAASR